LRSSLSTLPAGIIVQAFPRRSPPRLLTAAARGGLGSATWSPNPKDLPSSPVQLRSAVWTGVTRDTGPATDVLDFRRLRHTIYVHERGSRASGGIRVRRREFIAAAGGAAEGSFAVRAQQPAVPVIGYFSGRRPMPRRRYACHSL